MAAAQPELYDLMIVTDATSSMGTFLNSLNSSLQDIIRISTTTACFSRIGVLGYRDYDSTYAKVTQWSGWHSRDATSEISQEKLLSFAKTLRPEAGGDWPEATRSGLARAYQMMRPEAKTIILLYADAPPHMELAEGLWKTEQTQLLKRETYGADGKLFADWVSAARTLSHGDKRAQVFSIIEPGNYLVPETTSMFTYLSASTGGTCILFPNKPEAATISKLTVGLLLAWMGADKQGAQLSTDEIAAQVSFVDVSGMDQLTSEKDQNGVCYLPISKASADKAALKKNIARSPLSLDSLSQIIPRREHPVMNFAKRYTSDQEYQAIVVEQLGEIIESDVSTIALNPVFGTLWRAVCKDRANPARDKLITRFGAQVDSMVQGEKKDRLKKWLEESYDSAGEILEIIKSVPEEARYPCVFLDPTVRFSQANNDTDDANNSMEFTRDELLEIGRSCDYRILRRLGRILTRLTYVNSEEELPAHIKDVAEDEVPRIPMVLAQPKYQRQFWKILLHTVLSGTMLAGRPGALLAALSVRMGIKPLEEAAYTELIAWRENWNTLDIPETWNTSCLSLLLEADKKHQQSVADAGSETADTQTLLTAEDRDLFEGLVSYKLLEMNMDTTLTAKIAWTPAKSKVPIGPVVVCKTCQFPRSVTVMANDGTCGMCATSSEFKDKRSHEALSRRSSPSRQNRKQKTLISAPCVTCTQCTNRVIYPSALRPSNFDPSAYLCPACTAAHPPSPRSKPPRAPSLPKHHVLPPPQREQHLPDPFNNRSFFHTVSSLADRALFPANVTAGTCTLCFSNYAKRALRPACGGRKGCRQSCAGTAWKDAGEVINLAALLSFLPAAAHEPLQRPARGLRFLDGLRDAVEERGVGLRVVWRVLARAECGKHWCFNCGEKVADDAPEIYAHMTEAHRTWFSGQEDEFDYDEGAYETE
ncbi:hypothetical protein NEMBOFW57_008112 [Staphylotrichum longicolle]|uniref:VWFA domain-containing protein n=1 Tax=Staphylotrichum longicolle TaxID=669026 RepID=A0AAD4EUX1_9PEZI|nr:hypothetical protein NEMBOFW57_008112 [Staphylotrichum longicolle]